MNSLFVYEGKEVLVTPIVRGGLGELVDREYFENLFSRYQDFILEESLAKPLSLSKQYIVVYDARKYLLTLTITEGIEVEGIYVKHHFEGELTIDMFPKNDVNVMDGIGEVICSSLVEIIKDVSTVTYSLKSKQIQPFYSLLGELH